MMQDSNQPRIVIIGSGFGGLQAARALARAAPSARLLVLDRHNYHTFTPLLYQVATASLEPEEIVYPVRSILRGYRTIQFQVAEVTGIELDDRLIRTRDGQVPYDYLIVAAGSVTSFFGVEGAAQSSYGLRDLPEALALRNHLLTLVERAAVEPDAGQRRELLTVVIVGGGPTGVEMAGAVSELTRGMIARDFPTLDPSEVQVILVEAGPRLLSSFHPKLSAAALDFLRRRGVQVMLETAVEAADKRGVRLSRGAAIPTPILIWAAGVRAGAIARDLTAEPASSGRVPVLPTLQLPNHPEVYVVGDMAELRQGSTVLPMLAPVAMQQGRHAGLNIARQIAGQQPLPFHYLDRGIMATLGRSHAVAQTGPIRLTGFPAWVAWLALHLVELIGFRNRLLVLVNWIWDYFFFERGARVIIGPAGGEDK